MTGPKRDDAPNIPGDFGVDTDPYTEEDGVHPDGTVDDVDQPLPEIPEDYDG